MKKGRHLVSIWLPVLTIGYGCCVLLAVLSGNAPADLITAIADGAWGGAESSAATLAKVPPLLLTGLAVSLAYQVGLLNIGCEGQLTLGALTTTVMAQADPGWPGWLWIPCCLLGGVATGALWAAPAMWLRQGRGVHEVISTLLLNYVAIYLADYLVRGPLGDGSGMARSAEIASASVWHPVAEAGTVGWSTAPLVALLVSLLAWAWLRWTPAGYEARAVGANAEAAAGVGIAVETWRWRLFLVSGGLAGLAGGIEIVSVHHRFYATFSPGYGFDGITVAFLAAANPGWLWAGSLLIASLRATDKWLQLALGISPNAVFVMEAVLLLAIACQGALGAWLDRLLQRLAGTPNGRNGEA